MLLNDALLLTHAVLADDSFGRVTYLKVTEENNLSYGAQRLKAVHPVNYFPGFLGRNIKNCSPSKLFLFTSLVANASFLSTDDQ